MQIVTGKAIRPYEKITTTVDLIERGCRIAPYTQATLFRRNPDDLEESRTFLELRDEIRALGTALRLRLDTFIPELTPKQRRAAARHEPYSSAAMRGRAKIALRSANSNEWVTSFFAVAGGVGIIVPIDRRAPVSEVATQVQRSYSDVYIFEPADVESANEVKQNCPTVKLFVLLDPLNADDPKYAADLEPWLNDSCTVLYSDLIKEGQEALAAGNRVWLDAVIDPKIAAALYFTSGTTSVAKCVVLSQENLISNTMAIAGILDASPGERFLSVLPLHHTFAGTAGMLYILYSCSTMCFMDGLRYLAKNLAEWHISLFIGVPLLMENIHRRVMDGIRRSGKNTLVSILKPVSRGLRYAGIVGGSRLLFKSVLKALGGNLRLVVSGSAAADARMIRDFCDFGIDFLQGYGLTESSPVVSVTRKNNNPAGSVGLPLVDVEVAIDTDDPNPGAEGEVLTRSKSVMLGYLDDTVATRAAIDSKGWLHTGDIGYFDRGGNLWLSGRKKSMIVLHSGKKVFPEEIETILEATEEVKGAYLWGEPDPQNKGEVDVCALIQPDFKHEYWAAALEEDKERAATAAFVIEGTTVINEAELAALGDRLIQKINSTLPRYKRIRYILYTHEEMPRTTTLKVRRGNVDRLIASALERSSWTAAEANGKIIKL